MKKFLKISVFLASSLIAEEMEELAFNTPSTELPDHSLSSSKREPTELDLAQEPQINHLENPRGYLNGLLMEKLERRDSSFLKLLFIFSEKGNSEITFFKHFNPDKNSLTIDIYDTELGSNIAETLKRATFLQSTIKEIEVDLNQDIAGMQPDMRKVIRITLFSNFPLSDHIFEENNHTLNVNLSWNVKSDKNWRDFVPFF